MQLGSKETFLGAAAIAVLCLLGAAAHAQTAPDKVPMTDEVFKSVMLLKGIPVDTFFEAMGMFANSMGNDCTFCHAKEAGFRHEAFAEATPRIQRDRQMARNDALVRQGAIQAAALSVVRGLAEALARPRDLASVLGDVLVHCLDATGVSTGLLYLATPDGGFKLRQVTPIDQFLWATHVELVAQFQR